MTYPFLNLFSYIKDTVDCLEEDEVGQTEVTASIGRNWRSTLYNDDEVSQTHAIDSIGYKKETAIINESGP